MGAAAGPSSLPAHASDPRPPHHFLQPWHPWILDVQGQNGLSDPHIESVFISTQQQSVKILEALLVEEAKNPASITYGEAARRGE